MKLRGLNPNPGASFYVLLPPVSLIGYANHLHRLLRLLVSLAHARRRVTGALSVDIQRGRTKSQHLLHALQFGLTHSLLAHCSSAFIERSTELHKMSIPELHQLFVNGRAKPAARLHKLLWQFVSIGNGSGVGRTTLDTQRYHSKALQRGGSPNQRQHRVI